MIFWFLADGGLAQRSCAHLSPPRGVRCHERPHRSSNKIKLVLLKGVPNAAHHGTLHEEPPLRP